VGGDYIGQWSGANLGAFFERIGADTTVKYLASRCAYALQPSSASRTPNWWTLIDVTDDFPDTLLAQARLQLVRGIIGRNQSSVAR
jgi:hypothetical protein